MVAQSVFYIQESQATFNPGTSTPYKIADVSPGWTSSTKYAVSLWLKKLTWSGKFDIPATITQSGYQNTFISDLNFFFIAKIDQGVF